jgi:hypothetical protein
VTVPLSATIREDGFDLRLLKRTTHVALFGKSKPGRTASFEVIKIAIRKAETFFGRQYPRREVMPRSEQWGELGWSFRNRTDAEVRYDSLASNDDSRSKGLPSCPFASKTV